jgi:selenocysteine lyase/cysteine desulfurase/short-subunit dehydrogenase
MQTSLAQLRQAFPAGRRHRFLNYAATTPMLEPTARAVAAVARQGLEPLSFHFTEWLGICESARRAIADLIGARADDVALTSNTSSALSLVAAGLSWRPRDRVLYLSDEFPSNRYVWQNLGSVGVIAEALHVGPDEDLLEVLAARDWDSIRLLALSAVSYRGGRRIDVTSVARLCHQRNTLLVLDAVQAVGAIPVDVTQWGCDFLACGGQKWLFGPVGTGFLYIAPHLLEELRVSTVGWASSRHAGDFEAARLEFCGGARRFEPGLPDVAAFAGLGKSLEILGQVGWPRIFARVAEHNTWLRRELSMLGWTCRNSRQSCSQAGIVTVTLPSEQLSEALEVDCARHGIVVTHRPREIRISAHATTDTADLEAMLEVFRKHQPSEMSRRSACVHSSRSARRPQAGDRGVIAWRRALVTGASRGLGEGIATALARRGCDVTLVGRDRTALEAIATRLRAEYGVETEAAVLDLARPTEVSEWLQDQVDERCRYDVLVNNAAEAEARLFTEMEPERLRSIVEANVFAPLSLTRWLLPSMVQRRFGAILNVVSSGGRNALPLFSAYAASKGALWAWSESLSRELVGTGVQVTTFLPPHMTTSTQRRLARSALGYYEAPRDHARVRSPFAIGEQAVAALARRRPFVAPLRVRLALMVNVLAPAFVSRVLGQRWKVGGPALQASGGVADASSG